MNQLISERRTCGRRKYIQTVNLSHDDGVLLPCPRMVDISEGGVFIPTDSPLPVSTDVTLVFFLSSLNANVRASGTVVRSSRHSTEIGEPAGMAIELTQYGKLGWHLLKQVIEADELESIS